MKKQLIFILAPFIFLTILARSVLAHCPLCTAAVGAAAVSANYYGVNVSIIGVFIGAFAISTGLWLGRKIKKQYIKFQLPLIVFASFLLTVIPLSSIADESIIITIFGNLYWIDKITFGSILGAFGGIFTFQLHNIIKKKILSLIVNEKYDKALILLKEFYLPWIKTFLLRL